MKHTLLYIALALASFTLQPATVQAKVLKDSKAKKEAKVQKTPKVVKQLVVLHTNDTHSCVMPYNPNLADTAIANRGGYLRRVAMIKQERSLNPDLLLFDSGDFSQGSPYYSLFKGDVEVGLMNEMKYDAATIGKLRSQSEDANFESLAMQYHVWLHNIRQLSAGEIVVGTNDRELCHLEETHHIVHAVIELMVADGGCIILHLVH